MTFTHSGYKVQINAVETEFERLFEYGFFQFKNKLMKLTITFETNR